MKKYLVTCLCVLFLTGCAGSGGESTQVQPAESPQMQVDQPIHHEPEPAAPQKKGKKGKQKAEKKTKHVAKSEATIREELNATARTMVTRASRTITPSKTNKSVSSSSKGYVAKYIVIDPNSYTVEMSHASKAGEYNGFIRYSEQVYHCYGKTKSEALHAPCTPYQSKRVKEMIHYDGVQWRF